MPTVPPNAREEILATATIDPEFAKAWKENPLPPGSEWTIEAMKQLIEPTRMMRQKALNASRPAGITEDEVYLFTRDGWQSRTIICYPANPTSSPSPLIVMLFGGGHCVGFPESELDLARQLATTHNAVVALPSYRLAPDYPFPYSVNDSWDVLQALAREAAQPATSTILPHFTDALSGFILGGTSAGCALTGVLAHVARDNNLSPPLSGQFLCCGSYISPQHVPPKYQPFYLSREQNKNAPILDADLYAKFRAAHRPDYKSPLAFSFNQYNPDDAEGEVKEGHKGLPPAYFQVCGLDMSRDDGLIYEKMLREEVGIKTRLDLYEGLPHCWWGLFPKLEVSEKRMKDTVEGFGWLLGVGK
jgi:acetyl esterase/lipase